MALSFRFISPSASGRWSLLLRTAVPRSADADDLQLACDGQPCCSCHLMHNCRSSRYRSNNLHSNVRIHNPNNHRMHCECAVAIGIFEVGNLPSQVYRSKLRWDIRRQAQDSNTKVLDSSKMVPGNNRKVLGSNRRARDNSKTPLDNNTKARDNNMKLPDSSKMVPGNSRKPQFHNHSFSCKLDSQNWSHKEGPATLVRRDV